MPTFQNQATLYTNTSVTRSNVAVGEVNSILTMTKESIDASYTQGDDVTFVVSLVNGSATAINDLVITDDLGAFTEGTEPDVETYYPLEYVTGSVRYYVNGTLQTTAPTISGTQPLVLTGISVPANGNAMIIYDAEVTAFADPTGTGTITNSVTGENGCINTTAEATLTPATNAALSISKFIAPNNVNACDEVTFTFVIQNRGNTEALASDGVYIVDEFGQPLTITEVTLDGGAFTAYTYDDGVFTTNVGAITVPAATAQRDPVTGIWAITPGTTTLEVTGTI